MTGTIPATFPTVAAPTVAIPGQLQAPDPWRVPGRTRPMTLAQSHLLVMAELQVAVHEAVHATWCTDGTNPRCTLPPSMHPALTAPTEESR